jgi:hypothetical protein
MRFLVVAGFIFIGHQVYSRTKLVGRPISSKYPDGKNT